MGVASLWMDPVTRAFDSELDRETWFSQKIQAGNHVSFLNLDFKKLCVLYSLSCIPSLPRGKLFLGHCFLVNLRPQINARGQLPLPTLPCVLPS